ncbi:hypothetical protein ES708_17633 [subsurface metagenome]
MKYNRILSIIIIIALSAILAFAYNASTNLSLRLLEATDDVKPFREDFNHNFELVDAAFNDVLAYDTTPVLRGNLDIATFNIEGVNATELGYLDGVTSDIQTQLDTKITATLTQEEVDDYINALIKDEDSVHTRITITYDDTDNAFDFVVDDLDTNLTEEEVEDFVGGMLGGTETFISVDYQDDANDIDFVVSVLDEDAMDTDSATHLATQQSIKAYVDAPAQKLAIFTSVKEKNTSSIIRGQALYVSGAAGANALVGIADNTDSSKIRILGLASTNIDQNGQGYVIVHGVLHNIDTRKNLGGINDEPGVDWSAGDLLYVNSNGKLTSTRPTSGRIIKAAVSKEGSSANDDLLVIVHENPVDASAAASENLVLRMGDSDGTYKTLFKDYLNNIVAYVDSDGNIDGTSLTVDTALAITEGGTGQTSQTAAFDALAPTTTEGDILYYNGSDNVRLAKGTATQVLTMNAGATAPEWAAGAGGYTNLTQFVEQTAWRLFYSNDLGDVIELDLGTDGQYLKSTGVTSAPEFETPAGAGEANTASNVGTGTEIFKQKTGVDLEFRKIAAGSNQLNIYWYDEGEYAEEEAPALERSTAKDVYGTYFEAMVFTAASAHNLKKVSLFIRENATAADDLTVEIKAVDGSNHPTGSALSSGTITKGIGTTFVWTDCILDTIIDLTNETVYAIILSSTGSASGDPFQWGSDASAPMYDDGNRVWSDDSGSSWATDTGDDLMFKNYSIGITYKDQIELDVNEENIKIDDLAPHTIITIADGDTTPDISGGNIHITSSNTGAIEITDLDSPTIGQIVTLIGGSDNNSSTISDAGNFKLSAAMTLGLDDSITLFVKADNYYVELSRSVN